MTIEEHQEQGKWNYRPEEKDNSMRKISVLITKRNDAKKLKSYGKRRVTLIEKNDA